VYIDSIRQEGSPDIGIEAKADSAGYAIDGLHLGFATLRGSTGAISSDGANSEWANCYFGPRIEDMDNTGADFGNIIRDSEIHTRKFESISASEGDRILYHGPASDVSFSSSTQSNIYYDLNNNQIQYEYGSVRATFDFAYGKWDLNEGVGVHGTPAPSSKPGSYSESNVTENRTYDADSTTTDELADVLGTLIDDLRKYGFIG
jgi:hypothetical protein